MNSGPANFSNRPFTCVCLLDLPALSFNPLPLAFFLIMSDAISIENVSKIYRLGEINRSQFFGDIGRWVRHKVGLHQGFGSPMDEEGKVVEPDVFFSCFCII